MFAEEFETHDVNALDRTCRQMNELFTRFIYRHAKESSAGGGRPHLLLAVDDGNLTAVERFVEVGAEVNMRDTVTRLPTTAIHSCTHFGHVEIAELLIDKGFIVSAVDSRGNGALHSMMIGIRPKEAMVTLLVEAGADQEGLLGWYTPLHMAATRGHVRMVQRLLDLGADPNAADRFGARPVHKAAPFSNAATVRCPLEAGRNVEIASHHGWTPLHEAARNGMTENVKVLLELGADVSSVDGTGYTPLMLALFRHGNEASVHRILHLGASMVDQSRDSYADCVTSCPLRVSNHMTIETLLAAWADIVKLTVDGNTPLRWATARTYTTSFPRAKKIRLPN